MGLNVLRRTENSSMMVKGSTKNKNSQAEGRLKSAVMRRFLSKSFYLYPAGCVPCRII